MHKRVHAVAKGDQGGVVQEEVLVVNLEDGVKEAQHAFMLELQHSLPMAPRHVDDRLVDRPHGLGNGLGEGIEAQVDDPVKHLDKERELLHDPAVHVSRPPAAVRRSHREPACAVLLGVLQLGSPALFEHIVRVLIRTQPCARGRPRAAKDGHGAITVDV